MDRLFLPLGLLYVADALEKKREPVKIFHDFGTEQNIERLINEVKECKPKWVGFSTLTGPQLIPTIEASKRIVGDVKVVWGGVYPTMVANVESEPYVDTVVRGEGEAWVSGSPVTNMDSYWPAWHLLNVEKYGTTIHLVTSRGCPYRCSFCYSPVVWKRKWKCHSVKKIIEIFRSYPIKPELVEFRDDYFLVNANRAIEIVNNLGTPWLGTIRISAVTPQLLSAFKILPKSLSVGVESASQRLLDDIIHKDIQLADLDKALEVAEQFDVHLYLSFIQGLPTETSEERDATVQMASSLEKLYKNVSCDVKRYRCYPGTELFDLSVKLGFKPPQTTEEWAEYALRVWDE